MRELRNIVIGIIACFGIATIFAQSPTTYAIPTSYTPAGNYFIDNGGVSLYQNGVWVGWINLYLNQNYSTKQVYGTIAVNMCDVTPCQDYINYTQKIYVVDSYYKNPLAGPIPGSSSSYVNWALIRYPTKPACYPAANNCGVFTMHGTTNDGSTAQVNLWTLFYQGYSSGRGGGYKDVMQYGGTVTVQ